MGTRQDDEYGRAFRSTGQVAERDAHADEVGRWAGRRTVTGQMSAARVDRTASEPSDTMGRDVQASFFFPHGGTAAAAMLPGSTPASGIDYAIARAADGNGVEAHAEGALAQAAGSAGDALPHTLRQKFEGALGVDLGGVRVHTSQDSQSAAQAVGAKAYTVGQDIHFGSGHFYPDTPSGEHLLAHEVAHTVQQAGGAARKPMFKLEVSTPGDAHEVEADHAADAMVGGRATSLSSGSGLSRQIMRDPVRTGTTTVEHVAPLDTDAVAAEGGAQALAGAQGDLILHVSNAADVGDATSALAYLEKNQEMVLKGAAMPSPMCMDEEGHATENIFAKTVSQVPQQAIGQNESVMNSLRQYINTAGGQTMVTSEFQNQYKSLIADYGRLEAVAGSFGSSFKGMQKEDAGQMVQDAVQSGGNNTADLSATYQQLKKDPAVAAAQADVDSSSQALESVPPTLAANVTTAVSALTAFGTSVISASVASKGANSLKLRNALQQAKLDQEEAKKSSEMVKDILISGGADAAKEAGKAMIVEGAGWGWLAAEGAATGGTALAAAAADKLIVEPAKKLLSAAVASINRSAGHFTDAELIDSKLDAAKTQQDTATLESAKAATSGFKATSDTAAKAVDMWVKTEVDFETKKAQLKTKFGVLSRAMKAAAGARGKGAQGKALAEMTGFLHETEQFVVQANAVIEIAKQGANTSNADDIPRKAREALLNIKSVSIWAASPYEFKGWSGAEPQTFYNAQQVTLHVEGPGLDATDRENAGEGRADAVDPNNAGLSVNKVVSNVTKNAADMRDKVLAVRNEISAQVFGAGGGQ